MTTDISRHERLKEIHSKLSTLRNEIEMIGFEDELWMDWLSPCIGGITCVMTTLYDSTEEVRKHYEKHLAPKQ